MRHRLDGLTDEERRAVVSRAVRLYRKVRRRRGWDLADLFQAGVLGVLEARRTYDGPSVGWVGYAASAAQIQMLRVVYPSQVQIDGRNVRRDIMQDAVEIGPDDVPHRDDSDDESPEEIEERVGHLLSLATPQQREAFVVGFGLGGEVRISLDKGDADSVRAYDAVRHKIHRGIARIRKALERESA